MASERDLPEPSARKEEPSVLPAPVNLLLTVLGTLFLLLFLLRLHTFHWNVFSDLDQIIVAGKAWRLGIPPYSGASAPFFQVPNGPTNAMLHTYYYAPLCGMLTAPLSMLSYPVTVSLWKYGVFGLLLFSLWQFSRLALPKWPFALRWFALGLLAHAGSIRWNLIQLQPTALVIALLVLFACAAMRARWNMCVLLGILISIKPTYLLPAVGMLLFLRQYRILAAMLGLTLLLNGIALLPTGPVQTIADWREAMRTFEMPGKMTWPDALDSLTTYLMGTPESPLAKYLPQGRGPGEWAGDQIHLPFLFSAWGFSVPQAKFLGYGVTLVFLFLLVSLWRRMERSELRKDTLFLAHLFSVLLAFSLVIVYHQRYDAIALLPLLITLATVLRHSKMRPVVWGGLAATLLVSCLLTSSLLDRWIMKFVLPQGRLYLTPLCAYLTLAGLLAGFISLLEYAKHPQSLQNPPSDTP